MKILKNKITQIIIIFLLASIAAFFIIKDQNKKGTLKPTVKLEKSSKDLEIPNLNFDSLLIVTLSDSNSKTRKLLDSIIREKKNLLNPKKTTTPSKKSKVK